MIDTEIPRQARDAMVCYCVGKTHGDLAEEFSRCGGSLERLQAETKVGMVCGGCRIVLDAAFGKSAGDAHQFQDTGNPSTAFIRPGSLTMRGYLIANGELDSVIYACNSAPPQYGDRDMGVDAEYWILDRYGREVMRKRKRVPSGHTFCFDTREESLPRPFHGSFVYQIHRSNYGASRFNLLWIGKNSVCGTHEIGGSGRPKMSLPVEVDTAFLQGPNEIFLAVQNPKPFPVICLFKLFDQTGKTCAQFGFRLGAESTRWIAGNTELYAPVLRENPCARLLLEIDVEPFAAVNAPTVYFLIHNHRSDVWSANHL